MTKTKKITKKMVLGDHGNGVKVVYNWMTRGYIVFWHDQIIAMPNDLEDAHWYLTVDLRLNVA
jgi:hypothetical protein